MSTFTVNTGELAASGGSTSALAGTVGAAQVQVAGIEGAGGPPQTAAALEEMHAAWGSAVRALAAAVEDCGSAATAAAGGYAATEQGGMAAFETHPATHPGTRP